MSVNVGVATVDTDGEGATWYAQLDLESIQRALKAPAPLNRELTLKYTVGAGAAS